MPEAISTASIAAMFFTLLVCFLFPIGLWIVFSRKEKRLWVAVLAGALGFTLMQFVIRLNILQYLSTQSWFVQFASNNVVLYCFVLAFTAALFETVGRLGVFKLLLRKRLSYYTGIGAGIGHGGIEAIGLIGMTYINNIAISLMINSGKLPDIEGIGTIAAQMSAAAPTLFLSAGLERIFTIVFHIALSLLLCYFIVNGKTMLGVLWCLILHTSVDFFIPLLSLNGLSVWMIEGILLLVAVLSVVIILAIKKRFPQNPLQPGAIADATNVD